MARSRPRRYTGETSGWSATAHAPEPLPCIAMHKRTLALLLLLAGCAPAPAPETPAPSAQREQIQVTSDVLPTSNTREITVNAEVYTHTIAQPYDRAWAALSFVFQDLGLTLTGMNPATGTIQGEITRTRRPLGGKSLPQLLRCGETSAGPNAARYDINMTVVTRVTRKSETEADVATMVDAMAFPNATLGNAVRCVPTPTLAKLIAERVEAAAKAQ